MFINKLTIVSHGKPCSLLLFQYNIGKQVLSHLLVSSIYLSFGSLSSKKIFISIVKLVTFFHFMELECLKFPVIFKRLFLLIILEMRQLS